jgi:hypothetical protein
VTAEQSLLAGFVVAMLVVLVALFQDVVLRLLRWVAGGAARIAGPPLRRALAKLSPRAGRADSLTRSEAEASMERAPADARAAAVPRVARARAGSDAAVDRTASRARHAPTEEAAAGSGSAAARAAAKPGAERVSTGERPAEDVEASPETSPEPDDELTPPPAEVSGEPARPRRSSGETLLEQIGQRRSFQPASSLLVETQVREFLERRDGVARIDSLVRHLDREFGQGMGRMLLEPLIRRNVVAVERRPGDASHIWARLRDEAPGPRRAG